jgi:hypothetical protein
MNKMFIYEEGYYKEVKVSSHRNDCDGCYFEQDSESHCAKIVELAKASGLEACGSASTVYTPMDPLYVDLIKAKEQENGNL